MLEYNLTFRFHQRTFHVVCSVACIPATAQKLLFLCILSILGSYIGRGAREPRMVLSILSDSERDVSSAFMCTSVRSCSCCWVFTYPGVSFVCYVSQTVSSPRLWLSISFSYQQILERKICQIPSGSLTFLLTSFLVLCIQVYDSLIILALCTETFRWPIEFIWQKFKLLVFSAFLLLIHCPEDHSYQISWS